ncbi:copper resistance CopC family protein [Brevibacterium aurantiacum]|uniref:Copper resistance protein CopC n=1 Tax=Brevibacterium aurantiacum TaxID=273384 RepID=A0A556CAM3_BREAU|nr:copper resistance CopC family protein [Brevibacterium aurantiacum]TSI14489.1 copper resistance protein CopC [Brevibacterium aurantiacum]
MKSREIVKVRRRWRSLAATALLFLSILLVPAGPAAAHDTLVSTDPAAGSEVDAADEIDMVFNNDPQGLKGSNVTQVRGPDGRYYETACPNLSGRHVITPVGLGAAGEYSVTWRVVSSDGHPISGSFSFTSTVAGPRSAGADAPQCGEAEGADQPSEAPASRADSGGNGLWLGLGLGAVTIVVVGLVVVLILRRPATED